MIIFILLAALLVMAGVLIGVLVNSKEADLAEEKQNQVEQLAGSEVDTPPDVGLTYETAKDAEIDFTVLKEENPEVFAWLYVPGTSIDYPVLQSEEKDTYYESHDKFKNESDEGAIYTEMANMKNMCDFNTVLHGKGGEDGLFTELYRFADPEFFNSHEKIYIYLEDNLLTYEVFAAFERDNTSLIRTYDFTYISGCQTFLEDLYGSREMGKNIREGWEDVTPYHFLITLTTTSSANPDKQYVVIAALVGDAAGTIDRLVVE
ncbi:MAG: class B sortase [Lachnospiraceae bacterium]|nr:class B sortase [Lachnospiraceae bacterium]